MKQAMYKGKVMIPSSVIPMFPSTNLYAYSICILLSTFWKAKMHVISTFFFEKPSWVWRESKKNRRAFGKILCLPIFCLFSFLCQACVEGCRNRLLVKLLADDAELYHAVADLLVPVLRDVRVLGEDFLLLFRACGGNPLS